MADLDGSCPGQWALVGHPGYQTADMQMIGNDRVDGVAESEARAWQRRWFMDRRIKAYFEANEIEAIRYDEAERI